MEGYLWFLAILIVGWFISGVTSYFLGHHDGVRSVQRWSPLSGSWRDVVANGGKVAIIIDQPPQKVARLP